MLSPDRAGADIQRRTVDALNAQQVECRTSAGNVADRIDRADFVKMDPFDRYAVNLGLRFAELLEHRARVLLRAAGETRLRDQIENIVQMAMARALPPIHMKLRCCDAAP